jgi:hypothetical protein
MKPWAGVLSPVWLHFLHGQALESFESNDLLPVTLPLKKNIPTGLLVKFNTRLIADQSLLIL